MNQSAGCASFASTSNPGQSTRGEHASSPGSKPPKSSTRCSNTAPLVRPAPPTALVHRRRARTGSTTPPALALRVLSPPTDAGRPLSRLAYHRPPARRRSRRTAALCRLQPPRRHHLPSLDASSAPSGLVPNIAYPPRYFTGTERSAGYTSYPPTSMKLVIVLHFLLVCTRPRNRVPLQRLSSPTRRY